MPPYSVEFTRQAERDFQGLARELQQRLAPAIDALSVDPRPRGCVKLAAAEDLYRIRVGAYRIVYEVLDDASRVTIARIRHRRDVYRGS